MYTIFRNAAASETPLNASSLFCAYNAQNRTCRPYDYHCLKGVRLTCTHNFEGISRSQLAAVRAPCISQCNAVHFSAGESPRP